MDTHRPLFDQSARDQVAARRTAGLVGIVITLLLLVVGLFLVQHCAQPPRSRVA